MGIKILGGVSETTQRLARGESIARLHGREDKEAVVFNVRPTFGEGIAVKVVFGVTNLATQPVVLAEIGGDDAFEGRRAEIPA